MTSTILFNPLVPWILLAVLAALTLAGISFAAWRGLSGWVFRGLAGLVILGALAGPTYQEEDTAPLTDIVVLAEDQSASQRLSDRPGQTSESADALAAQIEARANTELRRIVIPDGEEDEGTLLLSGISAILAEEPRARIAGIIALSDGHAHDTDFPVDLPAPMHLLLSGRETDWDRRLIIKNAPSFAIIDEAVSLSIRVEDDGAVPEGQTSTQLSIAINGGEPEVSTIPIGEDVTLPLTLTRGGRNVVQFSVPEAEGELTDRNNTALIQLNGVRDRLRVLLVSGEPHAGGRTWRNLLKSDSAVDLVHFTILRPPEKQDGVPVDELSLIAFPTRELFLEKIDDFDLIIFDRYKRRGILQPAYLENVANYVRKGGAVLIAAGPDFAGADSLYRSPLGFIVPAEPTARVLEEPYRATVSELGERHPVTTGLPSSGDWGRWMRQVEVTEPKGTILMEGIDERPLLILDRVEEGRVALLASDHAWLWSRGYEGGGPQLELLRRLAHWMMEEPELEEEALTAQVTGDRMRIQRRTLAEAVGDLVITGPDGTETTLSLQQVGPGRFETEFVGPDIGLYTLENGDIDAVVGLGPAAPREFENTIASAAPLQDIVDTAGGGILRLEDGLPALRNVSEGRPASGRGWIGLIPRDAFETLDVRNINLLPPWLVLLLSAGLIVAGWLREGRRS